MPQQRSSAVWNSIWIALLFIAEGCSTSASVSDTGPREWTTSEALPLSMRLVLTESALDAENLYPSTVLVQINLEGGGRRTCSGVLIDARLALTAAHCVCGLPQNPRRPPQLRPDATPREGNVIMDSSTCAASAMVTTVIYKQPTKTDSDHRGHEGNVRPHQGFRIVLDPQGNVLMNEADLAVIALNEALPEKEIQPASLAKAAVRLKEAVALVGFGYDSRVNGYSGERRSGRNKVAALETSGKSFLVGQKGSHTLGGDSGGPCFRDGMLVGIATTTSTPPVELSEYTSTYFYRDWLKAEITRARKARPSTDAGAP